MGGEGLAVRGSDDSVERDYGGTLIRQIAVGRIGKVSYAQSPYVYYYERLRSAESIVIEDMRSFAVYVFDCDAGASVRLPELDRLLNAGDVAQVEDGTLKIAVTGASVTLLIAGSRDCFVPEPMTRIVSAADIKKVTKPWGYELWLNGEHPGYAFKRLYVKSGHRTSLQYHSLKTETNVLLQGQARSVFKKNPDAPNNQVRQEDLAFVDLVPVAVLDVPPNTLHRLESITDVDLCEVSTPHLDDVIRVLDDADRRDGRIEEEHGS
jgi:mannose-6-phosphate isomerase-like protein (cupin superfamily)